MAEVNQGYQGLLHSKWDCKYHDGHKNYGPSNVHGPKERRRRM